MGQPKQLLPWRGKTVLEHVLDNLSSLDLKGVVVVLGFEADEIARRISRYPVKVVINREFRRGMSSSIRVGLEHVPAESAVMLFLADQPLIGRETIGRLIAEFEVGRKGIVVPVHRGRRGNPVLFHPRYRAELAVIQGDTGARGIVAAHEEDVMEVEVSEAVLRDIDTVQDYNLARELEKGTGLDGEEEQAG
ncbi:MAG: molybdenum hydroxylase accessory protein, YgfJ family [Dehalococcoidia bacterium]|nr:molybdenum hydroxylase accessory protein, YgfJ family [Dehalococcoidia bacterium]